jgi:large subunit ribosomal protein L21
MYAIVEIAGQQFKVEENKFIYTHRLEGQEGDELTFDKVLLVGDENQTRVGSPTVDGVTVKGKILSHVRGDKVIVFKKKRRKGYYKKQGHRQDLTKVLIQSF